MISVRSASAARQGGDDFQHLVAWNRILGALPEQRGLIAIEVEALDVGNVDDVVVRSASVPDEFTQVRYGVDLASPIDTDYLTKTKEKGTSLLAKFHRSWEDLGGARERPHLQLVTNKLADPNDMLMCRVDGRTSTLAPALRSATPKSPLADARRQLADHLGVPEDELIALCSDLRFRLGCHYQNEADHAATLMLASGMNYGVDAVRAGIDLVRQWVLDGRRAIEAAEVRERIEAAGLIADEPFATLLIQGIDHDPYADDADVALDFVEYYDGEAPAARRHVRPGGYDAMLEEIGEAGAALRAMGQRRVMVSGAMRLGTWFVAGASVSEVAGHTVLCGHPVQRWLSDERATPAEVQVRRTPIGAGAAVAVALAFSADPTEDVEAVIARAKLPVSNVVTIGPPGDARVKDRDEANGYAAAIKRAIRAEVRDLRADEVHLFMAAPAGLALLLGHTWNRVAPTTIWEDLGVAGYETAYRLPA